MFKIGTFSKLTQVSIRMLRYYDETDLLKPAAIDPFTHYRLYTVSQIDQLNKIIFLRDLGFKVSEIKEILHQWDDNSFIDFLDQKQVEINQLIQCEKEKLVKIEIAKRDKFKQESHIHYNVTIKSIPSYQVLSLRRIMPNYYAEPLLWEEMWAFTNQNNIKLSDNVLTIYHESEYKEVDVDMEICMSVPHKGQNTGDFIYKNTEPLETMACIMVYGSFSHIKNAYLSLASWLEKHPQYTLGDHSRQLIHRGPWNETNPNNYLTEIQIPLITS